MAWKRTHRSLDCQEDAPESLQCHERFLLVSCTVARQHGNLTMCDLLPGMQQWQGRHLQWLGSMSTYCQVRHVTQAARHKHGEFFKDDMSSKVQHDAAHTISQSWAPACHSRYWAEGLAMECCRSGTPCQLRSCANDQFPEHPVDFIHNQSIIHGGPSEEVGFSMIWQCMRQ